MYTQSYEETGRDAGASAPVETPQEVTSWRQLPPQANGATDTASATNGATENLQTVLEDSERHLDALWNMLNNQMNRLSSGYTPTTEAQAKDMPSFVEQTNYTQTAEQPLVEETVPTWQYVPEAAIEETPATQNLAVESTPATMPFNFMPTTIPPLALPQETALEEVSVEAEEPQTQSPDGVSDEETENKSVVVLPEATEIVESLAAVEPIVSAAESVTEPSAMPMASLDNSELPVSLPEPTTISPAFQAEIPDSEVSIASEPVEILPTETPDTFAVPSEAAHVRSGMLPPVRIDSIFRDNSMVVTAREAGGVTVLPTVTMSMESQPNQSLQMRSTSLGEMPTGETPLVLIESREEVGSDPSALRIEIAYTADAPDVVFEVCSQVEDEVQISMANNGSDLCISWEVSKQKGNYARAKATISRQPGDPEVMVEIQRFRDASDASVWCSLLSFSVLNH